MKVHLILHSTIVLLLMACSVEKRTEAFDLVFDKSKAIDIVPDSIIGRSSIIEIPFTDSSMIGQNPSLTILGDNFYIYHKGQSLPVIHLNRQTGSLNLVGKIGIGPEEYPILTDFSINTHDTTLNILSNNQICQYNIQGQFIRKAKLDIPALSFNIDHAGKYWFYVGYNALTGNSRVIQANSCLQNISSFLPLETSLLPLFEDNWGKGEYITFRESLEHLLYMVNKDSLTLAHHVKFPHYELPKNLHTTPSLKVVELLSKSNYAMIRNYQENNEYIFMLVFLNHESVEIPDVYYWIINKHSKEDKIIKIGTDISFESFLYYPQYLSSDNELYFIGYPIEIEENDLTKTNPVIVAVPMNSF